MINQIKNSRLSYYVIFSLHILTKTKTLNSAYLTDTTLYMKTFEWIQKQSIELSQWAKRTPSDCFFGDFAHWDIEAYII